MLDVKIKDLLNQQINKEFYSAYLYLAFSNYFSERNLSGFSNWYRIQAQEERDHAMLFLQYLENNSETNRTSRVIWRFSKRDYSTNAMSRI